MAFSFLVDIKWAGGGSLTYCDMIFNYMQLYAYKI